MAAAAVGCMLAACSGGPQIPPAEQPLSKETLSLLARKGMMAEAPIFIRIFKEESELEVWKAREDGRFYHFKTYPICNWSGDLGPKIAQGDKQAPEGFYTIASSQMKPDSQYYLAFNLGFPNAYDRANRRTGEFLMIHGKCKSAGCYAMTDALAEEIYALAREAFKGGQPSFEVHAFPFRMTDQKLARFKGNKWYPFWSTLKQGYDYFEITRLPPNIAVCERRYVVNVVLPAYGRIDPESRCPPFQRPMIEPFAPRPMPTAPGQQVAEQRIVVPGPKLRNATNIAAPDVTPDLTTGSTFATSTTLPSGAAALGFSQ
jgi:murein L,D-transpeptidase YafK